MPIYQRDIVEKKPQSPRPEDCIKCEQGVAVNEEHLCGICSGSEKPTPPPVSK